VPLIVPDVAILSFVTKVAEIDAVVLRRGNRLRRIRQRGIDPRDIDRRMTDLGFSIERQQGALSGYVLYSRGH
jgi:hypothetical protein